jgi:hypothetical protein
LEIAVIVLGKSLGSRWTRLRSFAASARRKSHIVTVRFFRIEKKEKWPK